MAAPTTSINAYQALQLIRDSYTTWEKDVNDAVRHANPGPAGHTAKVMRIERANSEHESRIAKLESDPGWKPYRSYCDRNKLSVGYPGALSGILDLASQLYDKLAKADELVKKGEVSEFKPILDLTLVEVMELVERAALVAPHPQDLTPCEKDCIEAIQKAGRRLHKKDVIAALKGEHGDSTIGNALGRLTQELHLLTNNSGRGAQGYGLPEWGNGNGPRAS
jgi:hypothetical protein